MEVCLWPDWPTNTMVVQVKAAVCLSTNPLVCAMAAALYELLPWRSYHWLQWQHGGNTQADAASARVDDPLLCLGSIRAPSYSSA